MKENSISKIKLTDLGYNDFFDSQLAKLDLTNLLIARVISESKEIYKVKTVNGEYLAKITGKQRFHARSRIDYPAVGDWVIVRKIDQEKMIIKSILSRKTILQKKYSNKEDTQIIATNIDVAFIVESLDRDFSLNRFERYIVLASEGKVRPVILLNKIDLVSTARLNEKIKQIKDRFTDIDIILTSTVTGDGLNKLLAYIGRGKTYCFLGSSGVGKSSIINHLLKKNNITTQEISTSNQRGKHTTTARGMYFLENGGIVIDNPGTREVGIINASTGIKNTFNEIMLLSKQCKYADCTHTHEPGCAVLKAMQNNILDENEYHNFIKLNKENDFHQMTDFEKREKDRKFGKFIKKSKNKFKKMQY